MICRASGGRPELRESLVNRADLSLLKTWFAPRRPSVRTSSSRPSGYARPFRFAKEFGPDQVLRRDRYLSMDVLGRQWRRQAVKGPSFLGLLPVVGHGWRLIWWRRGELNPRPK